MKNKSLIIIGAGATGLMAAKELSLLYDVTILEANDRIGGRIDTRIIKQDIIEGGAEFIHGELPVTLKLLKEADIKFVAISGKRYRKTNKKFVVEKEMIAGWDELLNKMKLIKRDITLSQFLEKNYSKPEFENFKKQVVSYAEGFDLADILKVSVRFLYKEWSGEDEANYRIPEGYNALTIYLKNKAMENGCKFKLNTIAKRIDWEENKITIHTDRDKIYRSDILLVTIPLHFLHQNKGLASIAFQPPILKYADASSDIGMGNVLKIVIKFKKIFWKADASFIFSEEKIFSTWWTQLPNDNAILTGWMGGPSVNYFSKSKEDILENAVTSLSAIFNISIAVIRTSIVWAESFNWQAEEFSKYGYSYDVPSSKAARKILTTPIDKTIFFAGEALYQGAHPGTVEAALVSGKRAALQIKKAR